MCSIPTASYWWLVQGIQRLKTPYTRESLSQYEHTLLMMEGASNTDLRKRLHEMFPERHISFSSYNLVTIAALIGSSDLVGLMPARCFELFSRCWPLQVVDFAPLRDESIDFSLHYNKLSMRDPVLQSVITAIRQAF